MKEHRELISEIKQIKIQYESEVSSDRKAWPRAIKSRVIELLESKVSASVIAREAGLPYDTVLRWRPKGMKRFRGPRRKPDAFKELLVLNDHKANEKTGTVTVPTLPESKVRTVTVPEEELVDDSAIITVTTPQGFKIDVRGISQATKLLRELMER